MRYETRYAAIERMFVEFDFADIRRALEVVEEKARYIPGMVRDWDWMEDDKGNLTVTVTQIKETPREMPQENSMIDTLVKTLAPQAVEAMKNE